MATAPSQGQWAYVPIGQVTPNPDNPRTIKDAKFRQLVQSIRDFPQMLELRPIVVNAAGVVLGGNMRLRACKEAGLKQVPVIRADHLTEAQQREFVVKDNVGFGEWDWDALANEWGDEPLAEWGLDVPDVEADAVAGLTDPDDVPESPAEPITRLGDLWLLGKHRLLCGDATAAQDVDKALDGVVPQLVYADPPYGIAHSGKGITANGVKGNDFGTILGDESVAVAVDSLTYCLGVFPESTMIFWGANYYASSVPNGFGWLVWDKQREGDTFSGAELAFVNKGVRLDVFRHMWHGMVKASEHGKARVHPTQKPVALAEWCFAHYGDAQHVFDPFAGSGSCIIAAEKSGRICYAIELSPQYCDVIVRRWEEFTGQKAVRPAS